MKMKRILENLFRYTQRARENKFYQGKSTTHTGITYNLERWISAFEESFLSLMGKDWRNLKLESVKELRALRGALVLSYLKTLEATNYAPEVQRLIDGKFLRYVESETAVFSPKEMVNGIKALEAISEKGDFSLLERFEPDRTLLFKGSENPERFGQILERITEPVSFEWDEYAVMEDDFSSALEDLDGIDFFQKVEKIKRLYEKALDDESWQEILPQVEELIDDLQGELASFDYLPVSPVADYVSEKLEDLKQKFSALAKADSGSEELELENSIEKILDVLGDEESLKDRIFSYSSRAYSILYDEAQRKLNERLEERLEIINDWIYDNEFFLVDGNTIKYQPLIRNTGEIEEIDYDRETNTLYVDGRRFTPLWDVSKETLMELIRGDLQRNPNLYRTIADAFGGKTVELIFSDGVSAFSKEELIALAGYLIGEGGEGYETVYGRNPYCELLENVEQNAEEFRKKKELAFIQPSNPSKDAKNLTSDDLSP